jgi:hypothetical protein
MHKPYSAFFIGTPTHQEQDMLQSTRLLVDFYVFARMTEGTEQIVNAVPDYVILPLTCSDKHALQLFHELRKDGRTCVIVLGDQTLTAFSGRGYRWRKSSSKTLSGFEQLLEWGKWPLPVNRRIVEPIYHHHNCHNSHAAITDGGANVLVAPLPGSVYWLPDASSPLTD